jgi:dTDP-glucose pyrophosphorylase
MIHWTEISVSANTSIIDSLQIIDRGALQIALVVDKNHKLQGVITDGDIRRGILRGISLESPVKLVMQTSPTTAHINDSKDLILAKMNHKKLRHIPLLDDQGRVIKVELLDELHTTSKKTNWVVLMAGGLGTRLSPMTDDCPKPLLRVGTKPILETILENFIEHGFSHFYISVNYRAEMIRDYFGDGSKWGVEIRYIYETARLGTAGALSLLDGKPDDSIIVMNGDLLTKVNFMQLLDFHYQTGSKATMCVREYEYQVPYGVVEVDHHRLLNIVEKPKQQFFVNGGIYVLQPEVLELIPKNKFFDMPSLFEILLSMGLETSAFPIREYWIDIGRADDFHRANEEFQERFQ